MSRLGTADTINALQWAPDGSALGLHRRRLHVERRHPSTFDLFRQPVGKPAAADHRVAGVVGRTTVAPDGRGSRHHQRRTDAERHQRIPLTSTSPQAARRRVCRCQPVDNSPWMDVLLPCGRRPGTRSRSWPGRRVRRVLLIKDLGTGQLQQITPRNIRTGVSSGSPTRSPGEVYCGQPDVNAGRIFGIDWSPDGARIAFSSTHNDLAPGDGAWTQTCSSPPSEPQPRGMALLRCQWTRPYEQPRIPDRPSVDGLDGKWAAQWHDQRLYAFDRPDPRRGVQHRHPLRP